MEGKQKYRKLWVLPSIVLSITIIIMAATNEIFWLNRIMTNIDHITSLLTEFFRLIAIMLWTTLSAWLAFTLFKYKNELINEIKRIWDKIIDRL